jgi:hypothetical protein
MPGLRSPDIPAWKIALKGGDLNPLQNVLINILWQNVKMTFSQISFK